MVGGISFWFVAQTGPIASSVNAPRQAIRMIKASIQNQSRVGISCRKYVSVFLYRHGDLVPLHPADLPLQTDAQITEKPGFSIRHLVWSFSCSHPAADAIEYLESFGAGGANPRVVFLRRRDDAQMEARPPRTRHRPVRRLGKRTRIPKAMIG